MANSVSKNTIEPPNAKSVLEWFKSNSNNSDNVEIHGLKNSGDVIKFLKSSHGKKVMNQIAHKIALELHEKNEYAQSLQSTLFSMRLARFLFSVSLSRKDDDYKKLAKQITYEQNKKTLAALRDNLKSSQSEPMSETQQKPNALDNHLAANQSEFEKLIAKGVELDRRSEQISEKYSSIMSHLDDAERSLNIDPDMKDEKLTNRINELNQKISHDKNDTTQWENQHKELSTSLRSLDASSDLLSNFSKKIDLLNQIKNIEAKQISLGEAEIELTKLNLVKDGQQLITKTGEPTTSIFEAESIQSADGKTVLSAEQLKEKKLDILEKQIVLCEKKIATGAYETTLLQNDPQLKQGNERDQKLQKLTNDFKGQFHQASSLSQMKAVLEGKRYFSDADGNPVNSLKEAELFLKQKKQIDSSGQVTYQPLEKIHTDDKGKKYLIAAHEDFNSMDSDEKNKAQRDYKDSLTVKNILKSNQLLESKFHQTLVQENKEELSRNKTEKEALNTMKTEREKPVGFSKMSSVSDKKELPDYVLPSSNGPHHETMNELGPDENVEFKKS